MITLKKDSWHYKLSGLNRWTDGDIDICQYRTRILKNVVGHSVAASIVIFLASCLINLLMAIGFWIFMGHWVPSTTAEITIVFLFACGMFVCLLGIFAIIGRLLDAKPFLPDGLAATYSSWKQKYCDRVKFE